MDKKIKEFNGLMAKAGHYLESELSYSLCTVSNYRRSWKRIREYMVTKGIQSYDRNAESKLFMDKFGKRRIPKLNETERYLYHGSRMLVELKETGKITTPARSMPKKDNLLSFEGPIGKVMVDFFDHRDVEERMSPATIYSYRLGLHPFLLYCNKKHVGSIGDIDLVFILGYLRQMDGRGPSVVQRSIQALRSFMRYVFKKGLSPMDHSLRMPRYRAIKQPKIPSTYTRGEVERLILSVDRSRPVGKRNYAIILLAARLGLRASDISWLKFSEIDWDTSTISIRQIKTGKELTLPLLPDVGNAIIDYLKHGRPESKLPYVFLIARPPYKQFKTSQVVTNAVQRAFRKAGTTVAGRRFGPHALRHSLGFRMLEESTVLPVISEVLGHQSSESARYYLRIDLESMRQCMLDVPPVEPGFYMQRGGVFYG